MRHTLRVPFLLIGLAMLTLAVSPAAGQIRAGDHYQANITTPVDYQGAADRLGEVEWHYELAHPGATYIALHFTDFDLPPGDYLMVSDPRGEQMYTLEGRGKMNAGTFWAQHIKGDVVILELVKTNPQGGRGFRIDEYAAGFLNLADPYGDGDRAICGTDDKRAAVCYLNSHPTEYDRGRAVARLLSGGSGFCTGWLASSEGHLITNDHCISTPSSALNTDYEFMAEAPTCPGDGPQEYRSVIYSGGTYLAGSSNLDYTLILVNGNPATLHGYLELDNRVAVPGEEIYIIGHPGGRLKEFSIVSTHPNDPTGIATVYSTNEPPCIGSGYNDVGYFADTEGGSSGSPVLARSSHKVIALHHCANCPNRGVPITLVHAEIGHLLTPGPAGVVTLDRDNYGCDDVVSIEVRDGSLLGQGTQNVTVTTTGGDSETVTLNETGANTGVFQGTIVTVAAAVVLGDGALQVGHGQTITVTYVDLDNGQGQQVTITDTATIDCVAPQILNVQTTTIEPRSAVVAITANEPVRGIVHYGLSCGALTNSASGSGFNANATVNVTGLQDNTTYYYAVEAVDEAGNVAYDDNGGACYSFTTPEVPDFFTEQDPANLDGLKLIFIPNGSNDFYQGCVEPITALPTDPAGGTTVTLSDDSYATVNLPTAVSLYGVAYNTIYIGSNGYVTFTAGDTDYTETFADHFDTPRVSALFDDLHPGVGGTVSWKLATDHVAATWQDVPERTVGGANTFQIELFYDGTITITHLSVTCSDFIIGLSAGNGLDPDFLESDLANMGACGPRPPTAAGAAVQTPKNTPVQVTLQAQDDGLPTPPAALTYIITMLPGTGSLVDVGTNQVIATVPYTLVDGGNVVEYRPQLLYAGTASFQFKANDGGVPPEGGDSNLATVSITVGGPEPVFNEPLNTNPGWLMNGQWQFGVPQGLGGSAHGNPDPTSGATGANVIGVNLAGDYSTTVGGPYWVTLGPLDLSLVSGTTLKFQRWLNSDYQSYAFAMVEVSNNGGTWTEIWDNGTSPITDSAWVPQEIDISAVADNQAHVWVRWGYEVRNGAFAYSGWNLDDIEVWGLVALPPVCAGDANCDGVVSWRDIDFFVAGMNDNVQAWFALFAPGEPTCPWENNDVNGDGTVSWRDIDPLVAVMNTTCP